MLVEIIENKTIRNVLLWKKSQVKSLYSKDGVYVVNLEQSVTEDIQRVSLCAKWINCLESSFLKLTGIFYF